MIFLIPNINRPVCVNISFPLSSVNATCRNRRKGEGGFVVLFRVVVVVVVVVGVGSRVEQDFSI